MKRLIGTCCCVACVLLTDDARGDLTCLGDLRDPNPSWLGGFGKQVALGSGYVAIQSWPNSYPQEQKIHVYSSANRQFQYTIDVPVGLGQDWLTFARSLDVDAGRLLATSPGSNPLCGGMLINLANGQQMQSFAAPAGSSSSFGWAVALQGNLVVIGDPRRDQVHVYAATSGQRLQTLDPYGVAGGQAYGFGADIAISGQRVAITDRLHDKVHVYSTETWQPLVVLEPAAIGEPAPYYRFWLGSAVGLEGDALAIGALRIVGDGVRDGRAYLYDLAAGTSRQLVPDSSPWQPRGADVDVDGGRVLVGAVPSDLRSGGCWVDVFDAATGDPLGRLVNPHLDVSDYFGWVLDLDDGRAVVSDMLDTYSDPEYRDRAGRAFMFEVAQVPEPPTALLAAIGVAAMLCAARLQVSPKPASALGSRRTRGR
jgi:hypothetical protein